MFLFFVFKRIGGDMGIELSGNILFQA